MTTIRINVDADTAAIARVKAELEALCRSVDDCSKTSDKHSKSLKSLAGAEDDVADSVKRTKKTVDDIVPSHNKNTKSLKYLLSTKYQLIDITHKLFKGIEKLGKLAFKGMAIQALAAAGTLALSTLMFKSGARVAKIYQGALNMLSGGLLAAAAAAAVFLAAQQQINSAKYAGLYADSGTLEGTDKITEASGAMKMFTQDSQLAIIGAKGLTAAFGTLSKQRPVTGETLGVFKSLSDYTASNGGDLEKQSDSLAKFLAAYQKAGVVNDSVTTAAKELGPEFEKILKESGKLGIKTYADFAKAAQKGELGETFAKYRGGLQGLNSTLVGTLKTMMGNLKGQFASIGEPMLQGVTNTLHKIEPIISALLTRITSNVQGMGTESKLETVVNLLRKASLWLGNLLTRDLNSASSSFGKMMEFFKGIRATFEKVQDFMRPLTDAGQVLLDIFGQIGGGVASSFVETLEYLADLLTGAEGDNLKGFVSGLGAIMGLLHEKFLLFLKAAMDVLPIITLLFKPVELLLKLMTGVVKVIQTIGDKFGTIGRAISGLIILFMLMKKFYLMQYLEKKLGAAVKVQKVWVMNNNSGPGNQFKRFSKAKDLMSKVKGKIPFLGGGAGAGGAGAGGAGAGGAGAAGASTAATAATAILPLIGGLVSGKLSGDYLFNRDDSIKSRTMSAGVGAAGGAAIGATVGAIFAPFTFGLSVAVGAAIGGITGAVTGFLTAGRTKKAARKAANKIVDDLTTGIDDAVKDGDLEAMGQSLTAALKLAQAQFDKGGISAGEMEKRRKDLEAQQKRIDVYNQNASKFKLFFGEDTDQMNKYFKEQGTQDGTKSVENIFDIIKNKGLDATEVVGTLFDNFNQQLLEARLLMYDSWKAAAGAMKDVDAAYRKIAGGATDMGSITDFLKKEFQYNLVKTGGNVYKAMMASEENLKEQMKVGGALEKVAPEINQAIADLRLDDYGVLLEQITKTGELNAKATLLSDASGGLLTESQARLLVAQAAAVSGGTGMNAVDEGINAYLRGSVSSNQLVEGIGRGNASATATDPGKYTYTTANGERVLNDANKTGKSAFVGGAGVGITAPVFAGNQSMNVNNTSIAVSGVLDEASIKKIAAAIAATQSNYTERQTNGRVVPKGAFDR